MSSLVIDWTRFVYGSTDGPTNCHVQSNIPSSSKGDIINSKYSLAFSFWRTPTVRVWNKVHMPHGYPLNRGSLPLHATHCTRSGRYTSIVWNSKSNRHIKIRNYSIHETLNQTDIHCIKIKNYSICETLNQTGKLKLEIIPDVKH